MKVSEERKSELKAKIVEWLKELEEFEKEPGVLGMPVGVWVHDAKRGLVRLLEHL